MIKHSHEHARVRIAAMRALRSGIAGHASLTARTLARFAECNEDVAGAVLRVLAHEKQLQSQDGKTYKLAPGGEKAAMV